MPPLPKPKSTIINESQGVKLGGCDHHLQILDRFQLQGFELEG